MHDNYEIYFFDEIDSTNNEAKRRIAAMDSDSIRPFVLAARSQTAGRGRQGKSFYSPKGTGIYLTAVCPVDCPIEGQVTMTTKAAVAVSRAIEGFFGTGCAIKWVNDIYINDRKCCGILCEAVNDYERNRLKAVVIGVGVNVSTSDWPEDIANIAGSIRKEKLNDAEFEGFTQRLSDEIMKVIYEPDGSEMEYYRAHSYVIGREISFIEKTDTERTDPAEKDTGTDSIKTDTAKTDTSNTVSFTAQAVDIDENGGLIVKMPSGELKTLDSGEITVRLV